MGAAYDPLCGRHHRASTCDRTNCGRLSRANRRRAVAPARAGPGDPPRDGFDAYAWLLTDPETEVGSAPLADVPCLPELPRLIRLKYLTLVNRWTALPSPVAFLTTATGGHLERSLVWKELLSRYQVSDVASLVFRSRDGCWGFVDLWRLGGSAFTDEEAVLLTAIAKPVTIALRRCQANTFRLAAAAPVRAGPVVLVLSPDLDVRAQTVETEDYLRMLVPAEPDRRAVPARASK